MEETMRNEATIEYTITCHAAPLQIEGTISNGQGERRPFYFRNRNDSIYCIMGEWTDLVPEGELDAWSMLQFEEKPFSLRQTVSTDKDGFADEISLKEALGFIMMAHELSL
jgi:hypothetical protein